MIREHFNQLRAEVERSTDLPEATRSRLLQLADELENEVMSSGAADRAGEIDRESDEASEPSGSDSDSASSGLVSAIEGFEASHPELSNAVSNVAAMLSKLGF